MTLISVIIPTMNDYCNLSRCLHSLLLQNYEKKEIIVVDSSSKVNDSTPLPVSPIIKVIKVNARMSEARRVGASVASGEYLLFIDSDMELLPDTLSKCAEQAMTGCSCVVIPEISRGDGYWSKTKAFERQFYIGDSLIESARFFKKDLYWATGGHDPSLIFGEDKDIDLRIKALISNIGRINVPIIHHEGKLTLSKMFRKKYSYGKSFTRFLSKHPREAKQQVSPFRAAFLRNKRLFFGDYRSFGVVVLKAVEFAGFVLGVVLK